MSGRSENIRFNVYLNDRQAGNTMGNLYKQSRMLKSELRKLKIGSQEWISKMRQLQKVEKGLSRVRGEMRNTNSTLGRMAGSFNKYFGIMMAGIAGVTAAVYGLRQSTQVFAEFEKTMANVLTLLSDADKLKYRGYLKKGSLDIVKKYGFAVADTNKSLFDAISAGVEAGKSIEFMNQASVLAIGGVTDLHTSVDGLTTIINAFKLQTSDASDVSAAFFSAQKEGKTTVAELASGIGKAAPLAHSLGISYQQLLSATAALTKGGIDTESAFTYLRGVFSSMIKPTTELTRLFKKEFGHAINASEVKALGFTKVMDEMNILMKKYPNQLQASVKNVRALTAVTALSGEGLKEYKDILEKVNSDVGKHNSLIKAFAEQETTVTQAMNEAKGKLTAMTISLVEGFKPAIMGGIRIVSKFSHLMLNFGIWMKEHAKTVKFYAKALAVVLTSLVTYKVVLAAANAKVNIAIKLTGLMQNVALRASIAYNRLTGNIGRAAAAQRVLNTTMKVNPLGLIMSAISLAVTAYMLFKDTVKKTTKEQIKLNKAIKEGKDLMTNSQPIEKRYQVIDKLSRKQLKNLKDDIKTELDLVSKKEAKILTIYTSANNYHVKNIIDLNRKLKKETNSHNREMLKMQIFWENKKLDEEIKREQGISATELDEKVRSYNKMVNAIDAEMKKNPLPATGGGGGDGGDKGEAGLKKMQDLNAEIQKLAHQQELRRMNADTREIQQIKDKYSKLIKDAKGYDAQIKRLKELRDADINRTRAEQDATYLQNKAAVQRKIDEMGYDSQQKELAASDKTFNDLIALATEYGIDTTELVRERLAAEQTIKDKYANKDKADKDRQAKEDEQRQIASQKNTLAVLNNTAENIKGVLSEQSVVYKALAIFQTTIATYAAAMDAYKSAAKVPMIGPILAPIAAGAAIAFGLAQVATIVGIKQPSYSIGGVAAGASHDEGGIAMIDSKTGKKVGEMEGGEPYMILSKETYKNNRRLINALLNSSMNHGGESVEWMQPGYYPHPDIAGAMSSLHVSRYATGTVTNISNVYNQQTDGYPPVSNTEMLALMTEMRDEMKKLKYIKAVIDIDGTLKLKDGLKTIENIETNAGL